MGRAILSINAADRKPHTLGPVFANYRQSRRREHTMKTIDWTSLGVLLVLIALVGNGYAAGRVIAWPYDDIPSDLTNVVAIAAGNGHSLALLRYGTVVAWGSYYDGTTYVPATVPAVLRNVTAIVTGELHI